MDLGALFRSDTKICLSWNVSVRAHAQLAEFEDSCFTRSVLPVVPPTPPDELLKAHVAVGAHELFAVAAPSFDVRCDTRDYQEHLKMFVVQDGLVTIEHAGVETEVWPGEVAILPLTSEFRMRHQVSESGAGSMMQWRFPRGELQRRHPHSDMRALRVLGRQDAEERVVADLAWSLSQNVFKLSRAGVGACLSTLVESLGLLTPDRGPDSDTRRVDLALQAIALHLSEPDLTPTSVADAQGVSRRYLDGVMKRKGHGSVSRAVRRLRLARAQELLESETSLPLFRVAHAVGFENQSHFSRTFREHFGVSPSEYRKAHLS